MRNHRAMAAEWMDRFGARARKPGRLGRRVVVTRLLMLWVFVVSLYFLWEAETYSGLYALLAEWQFDRLGHYLPVFTFALLLVVFGSPAAWLLKARRRADARDLPDRYGPDAAVATSSNFRRALFAFSGGLATAALATLLYTLTLPHVGRPQHAIAVGSPASLDPPLGRVSLRGQILYTRTSAFAQNLLVATRGVRFAPMLAPGDTENRIRYFVELLPGDQGALRDVPEASERTGVLIRNGLTGSIVRLYRYAGYDVQPPIFVLFLSDWTVRWPYYVTAIQLALAALIALIAALFQHRHVRQITPATAD